MGECVQMLLGTMMILLTESVFEAVNSERDKAEAKEQAKLSKSGKGSAQCRIVVLSV